MKHVKALLKAVGKPENINTVDIGALPIVKGWLDEDEATRAAIVGELATALDAMRAKRALWNDIRESAWHDAYEFTQMVALGKAIDRLIRAKLPLEEATLTTLSKIVVQRSDFSASHLTSQLEHRAKTQPVSATLRAAVRAIAKDLSWKKKLVARLGWVASPAQPARVRAAAKARQPRR